MRVARLGGGIVALLVLAACEVHVGSGAGSPATVGQANAKPGAAAPAPAPKPHAPPPTPTPTPSTPSVTPPTTPMAAQGPHQVGRLKRLALRQTPPPAAINTLVKRDAASITRLRQRVPAACGPLEVAPNVFVHIDCVKYQPLTKAKYVAPLRRLNLFKKGRLTTDGDSVGGGTPKGSGGGHDVGDAPLPGTVDHRVDGTEGPVKDQDVVGSCTGFSLSTVVDNAIRRLNKSDVVSSMHVWSHYGYPNMSTAGDSNFQKPLAVWSDWPYDPQLACRMYSGTSRFSCGQEFDPTVAQNSVSSDPAVQQKIKDVDSKGKYKITNITRIYDGSSAPDTDGFAAILASGKDIWAAFTINSQAWGLRGASSGEIADWPDGPGGGHAVVISGYRTKNGARQFLIHNSWTEKWGGPEKGYAWLSENMVKQALNDAYTIAITDVTAPPPPPPPPDPKPDGTCATGFTKTTDDASCQKTCKADADCGAGSTCATANNVSVCVQDNPLTDDDCADDELVDDVSKKCAPMCADDSRPHNGKCTGDGSGGGRPKK